MDKVKIILEDASESEVYGIFYLYNSKYYFMYTLKEIDSNGSVILYLVQVGKELKNTTEGIINTGYMVGVEISDLSEWKFVQESITEIVEDKKNDTQNPNIQYLPIDMLSKLKIVSKKTFRLLKNIMENNFKLSFNNDFNSQNTQGILTPNLSNNINVDSTIKDSYISSGLSSVPLSQLGHNEMLKAENEEENNSNLNIQMSPSMELDSLKTNQIYSDELINEAPRGDVIIDYRARFFEEQEKNQQLQLEIDELKQKLESIKQVIE